MNPKNILIIGPSWVGDMIMAQSLFITLKQQNTANRLTVVAPAWSHPLLARMPEVDEAIAMPLTHGQFRLDIRRRLGKSLRKQNFEQAVVLPNSWKSALLPWYAKIKKRTGWRGEARWGLLNDIRTLDKEALPLMVQRFVALAYPKHSTLPSSLPRPKLTVDKNVLAATLEKFHLNCDKPILALCPGAEFGPSKKWPEQYYAEVAKARIAAGWQVWIMGSQKDALVANNIQAEIDNSAINLAGQTSLAEAIDLLSVVSQVVTNDSGLMHVSAALQRPLVVIYGSTSPKFTPPLSDDVKILRLGLPCSPCFKRECPLEHLQCMHGLKPDVVLGALNELESRADMAV